MDDIIIGLLVDRSGSMTGIWDDTVGGAEDFINEQKKQEGRAFLYMSVFDNEYTPLVTGRSIDEVDGKVLDVVRPRGSTALLDATARLINNIERDQKIAMSPPTDVVVAIMTDGFENSSREQTSETIKELIKAKEAEGWQFLYMGANQDAWSVGQGYGIGHTVNWQADGAGTRSAYSGMSASISTYRSTRDASALDNVEV